MIAVPLAIVLLVFFAHRGVYTRLDRITPTASISKKLKDHYTDTPLDGIPFHPFYSVKDFGWNSAVYDCIFNYSVLYAGKWAGTFLEDANFYSGGSAAKPPKHIAPVWYFTPYYAMLRAVPDKLGGVIIMVASIFVLFLLPWLDRSKVKSIRYRGILTKVAITLFVISFLVLGYLGTQPVTPVAVTFARIFTGLYFAFFLLMPVYSQLDKTKPLPKRVTEPVPLYERPEIHWKFFFAQWQKVTVSRDYSKFKKIVNQVEEALCKFEDRLFEYYKILVKAVKKQ